jgi:uncharacterized protein involved in tolerance to divalent cations
MYIQALISATSKKEAESISLALTKKKLVAGTLITSGYSRYWWKRELVTKKYWNISAFAMTQNKKRIVILVERLHSDECPIIAFFQMDGNAKFLRWVKSSIR